MRQHKKLNLNTTCVVVVWAMWRQAVIGHSSIARLWCDVRARLRSGGLGAPSIRRASHHVALQSTALQLYSSTAAWMVGSGVHKGETRVAAISSLLTNPLCGYVLFESLLRNLPLHKRFHRWFLAGKCPQDAAAAKLILSKSWYGNQNWDWHL